MITDVACNWRKAKLGHMFEPSLVELRSGSLISKQTGVFLPWGCWGQDVIDVRDWIHMHCRASNRLYARFNWSRHQFKTVTKLTGLTFEFADRCDIVYFILRWKM